MISQPSQLVMEEERKDTQFFRRNKALESSHLWGVWLTLGIALSQVTNTGQSPVLLSIMQRLWKCRIKLWNSQVPIQPRNPWDPEHFQLTLSMPNALQNQRLNYSLGRFLHRTPEDTRYWSCFFPTPPKPTHGIESNNLIPWVTFENLKLKFPWGNTWG